MVSTNDSAAVVCERPLASRAARRLLRVASSAELSAGDHDCQAGVRPCCCALRVAAAATPWVERRTLCLPPTSCWRAALTLLLLVLAAGDPVDLVMGVVLPLGRRPVPVCTVAGHPPPHVGCPS